MNRAEQLAEARERGYNSAQKYFRNVDNSANTIYRKQDRLQDMLESANAEKDPWHQNWIRGGLQACADEMRMIEAEDDALAAWELEMTREADGFFAA